MRILGIDIGGTKTLVGVVERSGTILSAKRVETPGSLGPDKALALIKSAGWEAVEKAGVKIDAIGIGCGGPLDRKTGTLHAVPNLPGWEGLCLTDIFSQEFGAPAYLDNDATAAAIGELYFGAGKGCRDFAFFIVSTGIGGGIVIEGKPYRGYGDNAGEFGHQKIRPDGPLCPCGDRGCLESLASGTSIARIARERLAEKPKTVLWDWVNTPADITAELIARAAKLGDKFASSVWFEAMYNLGLGVANVVNILNPRLVILGGGVTRAGEEMVFEPVRKVVRERAMKALAADVEVVPAGNGDNVGLLGAVAVALEQCGDRSA